MLVQSGKLAVAMLVTVFIGFSSAHALVIGAGQSATIDFDFSGSQAAIDASSQPLTLSFEMITSVTDQFEDSAGQFSFQYLDIGAVPSVVLGYDATGGVTSLGTFSLSITTTDLVGSLQITSLTESIDLVQLIFSAQDFVGTEIISTTNLHIPEPGTLAILGLGLAGLGFTTRKRAA